MLELFMLGTGGTYPSVTRALSSTLIRVGGKGILMDCGEATQIEMQKTTASFVSMAYICITHLHADHVSGLLGMLLALKAAEKKDTLTIIGPRNIKKYVESMLLVTSKFGYPINFLELDLNGKMCDIVDGDIRIKSVAASHSVPCFSYSVELIRKPRFLLEKANKERVPLFIRTELTKGHNIFFNGINYKYSDFIENTRKGLKISYVTDTRPTSELFKFIANSDVAIIEGMYRNIEEQDKAIEKKHMIWDESVSLGIGNNVREIILTHYSPSLQIEPTDKVLLRAKCSHAILGYDGLYQNLNFEDEDILDENNCIVKDEMNRPYTKAELKEMRKNPELVDKSPLIIGLCKKKNSILQLHKLERITAYKYDVMLGSKSYFVYIYKTEQSMTEPYEFVEKVRDRFGEYNLYFVRRM